MLPIARVGLLSLTLLAAGCQTAYYAAMEKVGYEKRDILSSRVENARDAQQDAKKEIVDALEAFSQTVNFQGGTLEARYKAFKARHEAGEAAANEVRERVEAVRKVGDALFSEWREELNQYSSANLRARSESQLKSTESRYNRMIAAMTRAESRLEPALSVMRDQVLFLKHNLNARALSSLQAEVARVDARVNQLVADINQAVGEADQFIKELEAPPAAAAG